MMVCNGFFLLYCILVCLCRAQTDDSCTEGDVRLVGGRNEFEGRVEVCIGGEWGTVCGDSQYWGSNNAIVVCRQLFGSGSAFPAVNGFYGEGNGTIYTVTCPGSVRLTNLTECAISNQTTGCSHSQDGGVLCADPACREGEVRLFNNQSSDGVVMGQVELCTSIAGLRTKVCDTNWDDRDAEVVCRELGLPSASAQAEGRCVFGEGRVINFYDNVNCTGAEFSLNDCQTSYSLSTLNCGYAGVFCQNSSETRQTTGLPLPTSTINHATSSIFTSDLAETTPTPCATPSTLAVMPNITTTVGGTIRAPVSSSTATDPTTVTPTSSPSSPLLGGILGAVGALVVVLIVAIVAGIIVIALRRCWRTRKLQRMQWSSENGPAASHTALDNPSYAAHDFKPEDPADPEHLLINPLYTAPNGNTLPLAYRPGTDVPHTYEGIDEARNSEKAFPHKNGTEDYRPHPNVPSHLVMGSPERGYATIVSPGHEYAVLEQPYHEKEPQPYESPVIPLPNGIKSTENKPVAGNHSYAEPQAQGRQILNHPPEGYEDIEPRTSNARDPNTHHHPYTTLEPPRSS